MIIPRISAAILVTALLCRAAMPAGTASKDQEMLNQGKILIFDRHWQEAREMFARVATEFPKSPSAAQASYYIARCYQFEGRRVEAIKAYETFLQRYPNEPFLPAEARTAVVELAASLMEQGDPGYRNRITSALASPDKEVRYFAAIRSSRIQDRQLGSIATPILREIVRKESEPELVNRARIALLRLDPKALSKPAEAPPEASRAARKPGEAPARRSERMFHLVVYKDGFAEPRIELNLPVSLAQLAVAALDESAKKEIRKKGIDIDNVWESLNRLGPANILTVRDGPNTVKIWVE